MLYFENFDCETMVSPVDAQCLGNILNSCGYPSNEVEFLTKGFTNGFDLGYARPDDVKVTAPNLKLRVGDETDLWNKVMKEVKVKCYAGPFSKIPFKTYIQSSIGLVPKDNGKDTCLIFHLSYPRGINSSSINANTPKSLCTVQYPDFSKAIRRCLEEGVGCFVGCSDVCSAFRNLGILKKFWKFLVMKARSPLDGKWYYFFDKCLPFGAAISCALFARVSNAIAFIVEYRSGRINVNYLDDYLFAMALKRECDRQIRIFLDLCSEINLSVSLEKTFWGENRLTFLGLLIDTIAQLIGVLTEKLTKGVNMIRFVLNKKPLKKCTTTKIMVLQLQKICGFLNFLGRAVVPSRAFTRQLYARLSGNLCLKPHHHIRVTAEMKADLTMWLQILTYPSTCY